MFYASTRAPLGLGVFLQQSANLVSPGRPIYWRTRLLSGDLGLPISSVRCSGFSRAFSVNHRKKQCVSIKSAALALELTGPPTASGPTLARDVRLEEQWRVAVGSMPSQRENTRGN